MLVKNIYNKNFSFIQAGTSLVASANKQLNSISSAKMNTKNHILSVLSKNNYIKSGGLIQRSVGNSMRSMSSKSMQTSFSNQKTSLLSNTMLLSNKNITPSKEKLTSPSNVKQPPLQYLFHKYALGIRNPNDDAIIKNYSVVKESSITRKNLCHIHCFHLISLDTMFGNYLSFISETFDIIVTYTHTNDIIINKYNNITFLCTKNYGMDIGPKFTVYDYLCSKDIEYNYVFYMHSKSNNTRRQQYLLPFIKNLKTVAVKLNENNSNISCYFHNIIWFGDGSHGVSNYKWGKNKLYMDDMLCYLNIKQFKNNTMFSEGNFYILHKRVIDKLFSDRLLYNLLNSGNSFDYNWVNCFYKLNNSSIHEVYNVYKQHKYFGNNMATNKGHNGLADAMIEHVFERLPIILCKEYGISINILDNNGGKTIFVGSQIQTINNIAKQTQVKQAQVKQAQVKQAQVEQTQMQVDPEQIMHTNLTSLDKTLCIVACHTSSELKVKCLKANAKYFEEIANDIVYINSTEFKAANIIENMIYIDNDNTVCYGKYLHVLQNMDISKYDNVILTNDSYLITKSLSGFKALFTDTVEMTALCCSNEGTKHYPDFIRRYNKDGISKIIQFYETNLQNNKSFLSLIQNIEIKSHTIHQNSINVLYDSIPGYNGNIHIDNVKLEDYLYNKNYPIIKIKKMQFTTYNSKQLPLNFIPSEYRKLNPDLSEFNDTGARNHFINNGMSEGRTYKKNQELLYPEFLTKYLQGIRF